MGTRRAIRTHLTLERITVRQIRFALHGFYIVLNRTEQLIFIKTINFNSAADAFFNRFQCELLDRQQNVYPAYVFGIVSVHLTKGSTVTMTFNDRDSMYINSCRE